MAESTQPARCTEAEFDAARAAGLMVFTSADEIAIHKFADAIRQEAYAQGYAADRTPKEPAPLDAIRSALNPKGRFKPTPGEWVVDDHQGWVHPMTEVRTEKTREEGGHSIVRVRADFTCTVGKSEYERANAAFVAACSPKNVRELLAYLDSITQRLEAAEALAEQYRRDAERPSRRRARREVNGRHCQGEAMSEQQERDTEREAFEEWAKDQPFLEDDHGYVNLRYLGLHGQYVDFDVERSWRSYRAGKSARSQQHKAAQRLAPLVAVLLREGLTQEAMELEAVYKELAGPALSDLTGGGNG